MGVIGQGGRRETIPIRECDTDGGSSWRGHFRPRHTPCIPHGCESLYRPSSRRPPRPNRAADEDERHCSLRRGFWVVEVRLPAWDSSSTTWL